MYNVHVRIVCPEFGRFKNNRVCSEIAVTIVALIGSVASTERRILLTASHIGLVAALPCPPPCSGFSLLPV